jgi:hypothetical protein
MPNFRAVIRPNSAKERIITIPNMMARVVTVSIEEGIGGNFILVAYPDDKMTEILL